MDSRSATFMAASGLQGLDTHFTFCGLAAFSLASVFQKARPDSAARTMDGRWYRAWYLIQAAVSGLVAFRLFTSLGEQEAFLRGTPTANPALVEPALLGQYAAKYLSLGSVVLWAAGARWQFLDTPTVFAHLLSGTLWGWAALNAPTTSPTSVALCALVDSAATALAFSAAALLPQAYKSTTAAQVIAVTRLAADGALAYVSYSALSLAAKSEFRLASPSDAANAAILGYVALSRAAQVASRLLGVGKSRSKKTPGEQKPLVMRIGDEVVDASSYAAQHPGGKIIQQYHGQDATDAFQAFHGHSEWAANMLKALPRVDPGKGEYPKEPEGMAAFKAEIWRKYVGRKREFALYWLWFAGTVATIVYSGILARRGMPLLGGVLLGCAWAWCGFLQHHAGHVAVTGRAAVDHVIQSVVEGIFKGGTARWWRKRHNAHHAMPNKIGVDGDLNTTPAFAWDQILAKKVPSFMLRIQHIVLIPLVTAYVPIFFVTTKRFMLRNRYFDEVGLVGVHFYLAYLFFRAHLMEWAVLYATAYAVQGVYLFVFFGLNHFAEERVFGHPSWPRWQSETAVNWSVSSWFAAVLSGFLNLQIEHHFFPQLPPFAYPLIAQEVEAYCVKNNMPYRGLTFYQALCRMMGGLKETATVALESRKQAALRVADDESTSASEPEVTSARPANSRRAVPAQ